MKKLFSIMFLALLITSVLAPVFNTQQVKAEPGTIYIRADGSIDPPTAPIQRDGDIYTFTSDIYGSIVVERDNIVIDGAGHTLQGSGSGTGITIGSYPSGRTNVTVRNTQIKNFDYGFYLSISSNNIISGNNIANNYDGIFLEYSHNNIISGNNIANNYYYGIRSFYSYYNTVSRNNITANNWGGVDLDNSNYNVIRWNTFTDDGLSVWYSYPNVVENNTVNGKPLVYLEGVTDYVVGDAGQVILVNCSNIRVKNLNLSRTTVGVELWGTNNSIISGNNIANNHYGILLHHSSSNTLSRNNITANNYLGIWFFYSYNNTLSRNNIKNNRAGIDLDYSYNNTLSRNNIKNNGVGIYLYYSYNNTLSRNNITANNYLGIELQDHSNNNRFYHNNFINNTKQVYSYESINVWDDGYPSGGNYWSDYAGGDEKSGPNQDLPGGDGIGDTPYVINSNNTDHYPLMRLYVLTEYNYSVTIDGIIGNSTNLYFDWEFVKSLSNGETYTFVNLNGSHVISVDSIVQGSTGTRYACGNNSITISSSGSHTFNYVTQYYLTMSTDPVNAGAVSPGSGWYEKGSTITISATANSGYVFREWVGTGDGSYSGTSNPATITMNSPITEVAKFATAGLNIVDVKVISGIVKINFTVSSNSIIKSASYKVDSSEKTITPIDGSFDETTEEFHVEVNGTQLLDGFHNLYLKGATDYNSTQVEIKIFVKTLNARYSIISLAVQPFTSIQASDLIESIGSSATVIWKYDSSRQAFASYIPGFSGPSDDFTVDMGEGYFVYLSSSAKLVQVGQP